MFNTCLDNDVIYCRETRPPDQINTQHYTEWDFVLFTLFNPLDIVSYQP